MYDDTTSQTNTLISVDVLDFIFNYCGFIISSSLLLVGITLAFVRTKPVAPHEYSKGIQKVL